MVIVTQALLIISTEPAKVVLMRDTPASLNDKSIEPVLIECPSCKTKISSSADICYSCHNKPDRTIVDEQVARIHEEKRKRNENKTTPPTAEKTLIPPTDSKPGNIPIAPPHPPLKVTPVKPDTMHSPPPIRPADTPVSEQPTHTHKAEPVPIDKSKPLPPPPPDWPRVNSDDPNQIVHPPPVGLLELNVDVMPIPPPPPPDDIPATDNNQAQPLTPSHNKDTGAITLKTPSKGMMTCPGCSTEVSVSALMCYACGMKLREQTESTEPQQVYAYETKRPITIVPPPSEGGSERMRVICDEGHIMECTPPNLPATCPACGSKRLTYIAGELKGDKKGGMFGRKGGVSGVNFKKNDRMDELEKKYGRGY